MSLSAALVLIFSFDVNALLSQPWIPHRTRWSLASLGAVSDPGLPFPEPYDVLVGSKVLNASGSRTTALRGLLPARKENLFDQLPWSDSQRRGALVVLSPAFGDFDSAEYAELLHAVLPDLRKARIDLRIIGIGSPDSCRLAAAAAKMSRDNVFFADPNGAIHRALGLHGGPDWDVPSFVPEWLLEWFADYTGAGDDPDKTGVARAWLNYMAMCAGIAAPDTLPEILRGYVGDRSAPERLRFDETIVAGDGFVEITGVSDVVLGPIRYRSAWADEVGYQRPAELATVRLRALADVLENFPAYVPDQKNLQLRGATFLFDADGKVIYEHRDTGVLAYSETMARPLMFLAPYIGHERASNPLRLGDASYRSNPDMAKKSAWELPVFSI